MKGDGVNIDDYRYPGPRPQSRETALVMLADVVEAASRTLENPTPARIQGLVQNLINKVFSDGQLDNCELTLKDLHSIAKSFNKILNGIHHHRIEYPEAASSSEGKTQNGSSDRQSPKPAFDSKPNPKSESGGHLKRLGCPDAELSVVLVDDREIAQMNRDWLNREGPTNVLSFSMTEGDFGQVTPDLLGDVVISTETAMKEAGNADMDVDVRMDQLLIHGVLHLMGYDHEGDTLPEKASEMEKKASELLEILINLS